MFHGVDGQQRWSPFSFSSIQAFDEVFADFYWWNRKRIEEGVAQKSGGEDSLHTIS